MSKSYDNGVELFAPEKAVRKSIMGIVTDSKPVEAPKDPATCNVYQILKLFLSPEERAGVEARYRKGGEGYGVFKQLLLERFLQAFGPARQRREELAKDPERVRGVLRAGARRARRTAGEVLADVKKACGLT
jgi:tryptophanyl-tRNA synthetase